MFFKKIEAAIQKKKAQQKRKVFIISTLSATLASGLATVSTLFLSKKENRQKAGSWFKKEGKLISENADKASKSLKEEVTKLSNSVKELLAKVNKKEEEKEIKIERIDDENK
jgi:hypothetical protein